MVSNDILVADMGGTNARFAMASCSPQGVHIEHRQHYLVRDFATPQEAVLKYLTEVGRRPAAACFAVAGLVVADEVTFTSSHWAFMIPEMTATLGGVPLEIVNDFYALAGGIEHLQDAHFLEIKKGDPEEQAPIIVLGPGTGFGQALIMPTERGRKIVSTLGGHSAFAPTRPKELDVLNIMLRKFPRVTIEHFLSGRGLSNIYDALLVLQGTQEASLPPDQIAHAALADQGSTAWEALALFCAVLGSIAGDAVLSTGARGGVVIGGGILPKMPALLKNTAFVERFLDKGSVSAYLADVPVRLLMSDEAPLYGAASVVSRS